MWGSRAPSVRRRSAHLQLGERALRLAPPAAEPRLARFSNLAHASSASTRGGGEGDHHQNEGDGVPDGAEGAGPRLDRGAYLLGVTICFPQNWSSPCGHTPPVHPTGTRLVHKSAPSTLRTRTSQPYTAAEPITVIRVRTGFKPQSPRRSGRVTCTPISTHAAIVSGIAVDRTTGRPANGHVA